MRPQLIREAIDQYARRQMPRQADLWPVVQRAVAQQQRLHEGIQVEPLTVTAPTSGEVKRQRVRDDIRVESGSWRSGLLVPMAVSICIVLAALILTPLLAHRAGT